MLRFRSSLWRLGGGLLAPLFISGLSLLGGCASYSDQMKAIQSDYRSGRYKNALEELEQSELKEQSRNKLLYQLEKATLLDRLGQEVRSQKLFIEADKTVDRLYRASISGAALSYIYNDSATDYQGEDYEKVAIHTMLAISYLGEGQLNEARVESRAINLRLEEINNFYEENKNTYKTDAFARYLSGLIYEAKGELDSAIIDYAKALEVYQGDYSKHFDTGVPDGLLSSYHRVLSLAGRRDEIRRLEEDYAKFRFVKASRDDAFIIVIHEVDTISPKKHADFVMLWDNKPLRFSFPVIRSRSLGAYLDSGVVIEGVYHPGDLAQNMDKIAAKTLEDSKTRYFFKTAARLILKDQLAQKAEKSLGVLGKLGVSIYGAVTETADTRSWSLMPASFFVTRVKVQPGAHTLRIKTFGRTADFKKVNVKPGELLFLRG